MTVPSNPLNSPENLPLGDVASVFSSLPPVDQDFEDYESTWEPAPKDPAKQKVYSDNLYQELGKIVNLRLPDVAVSKIMDSFNEWQYSTEYPAEVAIRIFRRKILNPANPIKLAGTVTERRKVERNYEGVLIEVNEVIGDDIRCLIDIERQLAAKEEPDEILKEEEPDADPLDGFTAEIEILRAVYGEVADNFTARQLNIISLMTHHGTYASIATELDCSSGTISRDASIIRSNLGLSTDNQLMLTAISLGLANVDHVASGKTDYLDLSEKEFIASHYDLSTEEQQKLSSISQEGINSRWSRIYYKIGVNNKHSAILYAIKDGLIELPIFDADQEP